MLLVALWVMPKGEAGTATSEGPSSAGTKSPAASSSSSKSSASSAGSSTSKPTSSSPGTEIAAPSTTSGAAEPDASKTGPYKLVQDWSGDNFFDGWTFWDQADPTHGAVNYLSQDAAKAANLISTTSAGTIIMKVDNTTKLDAGKSRDSVRIHSKTPMKIGSIVIADIAMMPFGCSTWPAWWTHGPDWPNGGEIDIIEGVNNQPENAITLHVSDSDCKQDSSVDITGKAIPENNDCNANVKSNQGCSYQEVADASYGEPFNKAGGGVLVTSFTKDSIDVWFWSRPDIPENIQKGSPDSSTWGKPTAKWPTKTCDIEKYFGDQTMIFDTTLCGDWAGAESVWSRDCGDAAPTCLDYLSDPSHFDNAFWEVVYVRVYETG
ncbi:hypothetical protein JCM16303_002144 [Sporobolomyces ruberrimus]